MKHLWENSTNYNQLEFQIFFFFLSLWWKYLIGVQQINVYESQAPINIISSCLSDLSNVPDLILLRIIVHVTYFSSVFAVLNCQTRKVAFIVSNLKPSFAHFKETSLQSPSKNNKRSVPLGMWSKWPAWYRHLSKDGSSTLVLRNLQGTDSTLTSKFHRLYTLFPLLKGSWMKHINKADC